MFDSMLRSARDDSERYKIALMLQLETETKARLRPHLAAQGLPFTAVISLPLIFAAGMSLMDTTDGAFMSKAYSWAFASPIRKVFYNLTVTSLSVFVALFVGAVELAQILIRLFDIQDFWALFLLCTVAGLFCPIVLTLVLRRLGLDVLFEWPRHLFQREKPVAAQNF